MDKKLKTEFWEMAKALNERPTRFMGTRQLREQLKETLNETDVQNTLILNHGQPRAVIINYETYDFMLRIIRKVTLQLGEMATEDLSDEEFEALLAEREKQRPKKKI